MKAETEIGLRHPGRVAPPRSRAHGVFGLHGGFRRAACGALGGLLILFSTSVSLGIMGAAPASATPMPTTWTQNAELPGSGTGQFAKAVAVAKTTALVGDYGANGGMGEVTVYSLSGGTWTETAELTPPDQVANGHFGVSVSLSSDGTTALVGADNSSPGHVYMFTYSSGSWQRTAEVTDGHGADDFGDAVSFGGAGFLVGADNAPGYCNPTCLNNGAVYDFKQQSGVWTPVHTLVASDAVHLGGSVGLSSAANAQGDFPALVVGDAGHAAYFFESDGPGNWHQVTEFPVSGASSSLPVAIYDGTALVGDPQSNSGQGFVYVLRFNGSSWIQTQQLTASGPAFGTAVALEGALAIVGAQSYNSGQGTGYVFYYDGSSWSQSAQVMASDGAAGDSFGFAVAMAPDAATVVLGAPQQGGTQGAAYIFSQPGIVVPCSGGVGDANSLVNDLAPGNGVYDLVAGCTYTLTNILPNSLGLPDVSGTMVINGNGATITRSSASGTPQFGFFNTGGGDLTLNDLTLSNGVRAPGGNLSTGGIEDIFGTVALNQVNMLDDIGDQGGGALDIGGSNVTIQGSTFSGDGSATTNQVIFISGGTLTVSGSTFSNNAGNAITSSGGASVTVSTSTFNGDSLGRGAIEDQSVGPLTVTDSTFFGNNRALFIGAGSATVTGSTITGNTGVGVGGIDDFEGVLILRNSTISDNDSPSTISPSNQLGALRIQSGATAEISGTLISGNTPNGENLDCTFLGTVTDEGYNSEGPGDSSCGFNAPTDATGDPKPLALASNGGPTETQALAPDSAAIDQIPPGSKDGAGAVLCPLTNGTDQRGLRRPQGLGCDIGAFEQAAVNLGVNPNQVTSSSTIPLTATVMPIDNQPAGTPPPSGVVDFYDNGIPIGSASLNGASPDTATLDQAVSSGQISVIYEGDPAGLYSMVPGSPSQTTSSIVASPYEVAPDGTSFSTVTVTLEDVRGDLLRGRAVQLTAATGNANISPVGPVTTDRQGVATFTVTDSNPEVAAFQANDTTDLFTLTQQARVDFTAGVPIDTVAGQIGATDTTDNLPATSAGLNFPFDSIRDAAGNVLIADSFNGLVRVVAESDGNFYGQPMTAGNIYTIAGGSDQTSSGIPAGNAQLGSPTAVGVDPWGDVIIGDGGTDLVRIVDEQPGTTQLYGLSMSTGFIYTIAQLSNPSALTVDGSGNILVADSSANTVVAIPANPGTYYGQHMTTPGSSYLIAGMGTSTGALGDGGPASQATLSGPSGVAVDAAGNVIIADSGHNALRVVDEQTTQTNLYGLSMTPGEIDTIAGSFTSGSSTSGYSGDGGPGTQATLSGLQGIAVDPEGNVVFTDSNDNVIRALATSDNTTYGIPMSARDVYTVAGSPDASSLGNGGSALAASISIPIGVSVYSPGVLLVADTGDSLIRDVGPIITAPTPSGTTGTPYSADPTVTAMVGSVTWSVSGSLPPGLSTDPSTGAISGTPTSSGTFDFTISATDSSVPAQTATTGPLSIDIAPSSSGPSSLSFVSSAEPPSTVMAGTAFPNPLSVIVTDQLGNPVANQSVTLSPTSGFSFASGNPTETTDSTGVASFSGLQVNKAGQSFTITANSGTLTATSSSFNVTDDTTDALNVSFVSTAEPPSTVTAGTVFGTSVAVTDKYNNPVAGQSITLTPTSGYTFVGGNPAAVITGITGVASFSGLQVNKAGTFTITATDGGLTAPSSSFTVTADTTDALNVSFVSTAEPPSTVMAGTAFPNPVSVMVTDKYNNPVAGQSVALTPTSGFTFVGGNPAAVITGITGVASFSGLQVNKAGTFTITATDGTVTAISSSFTVTDDTTDALNVSFVSTAEPPSTVMAGTAFPNPVSVMVTDKYNNPVAGQSVSLTPTSGFTFVGGNPAAVITGITGVASFSGLQVNKAGTFTITATDGTVTAISSSFTVTADTTDALNVSFVSTAEPPSTMTAGTVFGTSVAVTDKYNNPVAGQSITLTPTSGFTFVGGNPAAVITGITGVASFSGLQVNKAGTFTITATDTTPTTHPTGQSAQFTVTSASKITPTISWTPANLLYGQPLGSSQLNAVAEVGNTIVPGTYLYSPVAGTVLNPGTSTLMVTFTPNDTTDYTTATASVQVNVGFSGCISTRMGGGLVVHAGQAECITAGGLVTGGVIVQPGGSLWVNGGGITGSLSVTGASALSLCGASISGGLTVTGSTGPVVIGGSSCPLNMISGSVVIENNTGGVTYVRNSIQSGSLTIEHNRGGFVYANNTTTGAVTVKDNT